MPSTVATLSMSRSPRFRRPLEGQRTLKNRREQLWQSQEALTKAQDHLWELQSRLEQVTQRKQEEDQEYDTMDLQDGLGSWWDADSPGLDDVEEHARESSPQSWRSWGGYHYQPPQDWHKSQGAIEDLSAKFPEMQQYIGNITTQYSTFQAEVMSAIQTLTHQQKQSGCRWSWLCCPCDASSFAPAGTVGAEQEASEGQSRWGRQPEKVHGWCGRRRFVNRSVGPALRCAAGSSARDALVTVKQLRLHMGIRLPHDVLQMVGMQQREFDQMHEMFLGLPLAADEEQVTCLTIYTDGSASLDAAWPRRRTAAGWCVASHTGIVENELADRVALLASRGGVVSAIGPLPRRVTPVASQVSCPMTDEANRFWTSVMMMPDPKLFEQKGKKRTARPMMMRWGSANVLTLHETVGSAIVREKGLSASARRLDLEAQFNASGYSIVGLQETRCRREGDRRGRHYYMIGTA